MVLDWDEDLSGDEDLDRDSFENDATDSQEHSDVAIVAPPEHRVSMINRSNRWIWKAAQRLTTSLWNYKNNQIYNLIDLKLCLKRARELTTRTE